MGCKIEKLLVFLLLIVGAVNIVVLTLPGIVIFITGVLNAEEDKEHSEKLILLGLNMIMIPLFITSLQSLITIIVYAVCKKMSN